MLVCAGSLGAQRPEPWLQKGIDAFKAARYPEAVNAFERAVKADPNSVPAHLYLGTAWMSQYIPGAQSEENLAFAFQAEAEFKTVLSMEPRNTVAVASLAALAYNQSAGIQDPDEKYRKLDEAASWYQQLVNVNPSNKEAHYSLGVIAWARWYPAYTAARSRIGLRPEDPGPLPKPRLRAELLNKFDALIEDGIAHLEKAIDLDPEYDDAMAYMNLLFRERADLAASAEQYRREIATADEWLRKALDIRKQKSPPPQASPEALQPEPPPAATEARLSAAPTRIQVGASIQEAKLIHHVNPIPPADAPRVSGTVKLRIIVDTQGQVSDIELVSGHPLLVPAAMDAVRQWVYQPTLLNGKPVEVITTVDVFFSRPN